LSRQQLLAAETQLLGGWSTHARTHVCLLYPNTYHTGMSSLAVHSLYTLLNGLADFSCERAFLPSQTETAALHRRNQPLRSLESDTPLGGFDLLAVTTSFELDWLNLPLCLDLAGVPPLRTDRTPQHPFLLGGGPCFTANPAPVLDIFDAIYVGEIEPALPHLQQMAEVARSQWHEHLSDCPGFIIPGLTNSPVPRRCATDLDDCPTATAVLTPHTEFADSHLIEMSRGCGRGCSFCLARQIYHPVRHRRPEALLEPIEDALAHTDRIGLVAASVSDYPWLNELCDGLQAMEPPPKVSVSSMRADGGNKRLFELLAASGQRSVTFAPETGTEALRDSVCKHLSDKQLYEGIAAAVGAGLTSVKLYFIIGLPEETEHDRNAIPALLQELSAEFPQCSWSISVNPFVPKPHTALQAVGVPDIQTMRGYLARLTDALEQLPRVQVHTGSARWAAVQTAISRANSHLGPALVTAGVKQPDFSQLRRIFADAGHDLGANAKPLEPDSGYPWDLVDPVCCDVTGGDN